MSILHAILVPFNYYPGSSYCSCCDEFSDGGYDVSLTSSFSVFVCFDCADIIFFHNPSLFDDFIDNYPLVLVPIKHFLYDVQTIILDLYK